MQRRPLAWTVQSLEDGSLAWVRLWFWIARAPGVSTRRAPRHRLRNGRDIESVVAGRRLDGRYETGPERCKFYITRAANDINDQGVIVGSGRLPKNFRVAYRSHVVQCNRVDGPAEPIPG